MAFLVKNSVIINDSRELLGVGTAGINTALYVGENIEMDAVSGILTAAEFKGEFRDVAPASISTSTAPTTRQNGDDLQPGDLWFDSSTLVQKTWYEYQPEGGGGLTTAWVNSTPSANLPPFTFEGDTGSGSVDLSVGPVDFKSADDNIVTTGIGSTVQFALGTNISVGGSITAGTKFYGDGSELSGVLGSGGDGSISGRLEVESLEVTVGPATFTGNVVLNDNLVGDGSSNISGINSVTAEFYYGDGSNLTGVGLAPDSNIITTGDIQAGVITATTSLEATAGTGVGLTVTADAFIGGNVSVGSSVTAEFFYGDGSRLENVGLEPDSDVITTGDIQAGIITATTSLEADGVGVGLTVANDAFFGGNISVGSSVTAQKFYGDGSELEGIIVGAATSVTSEDSQINDDFPMPFLSATGIGATIFTDSTENEEFTYNPSSGILKAKEFDALSDARLKTDIVTIEDALGKVAELRGVEYSWKNGSGSSVGILAQELQEVYPQLVSDNGERLTVNYNGLVGLLIAAVNEISAELADLKAQK